MISHEPCVRNYMTKAPRCVDIDTSLQEALSVMQTSKSRFLPVLAGNKVVGILRENAARMAASLLGAEEFTASDWMALRPAVKSPEASLYEVLDDTPDNVCGCTVIQNADGKVVGIFTPREALMAMQELAEENRRSRCVAR